MLLARNEPTPSVSVAAIGASVRNASALRRSNPRAPATSANAKAIPENTRNSR